MPQGRETIIVVEDDDLIRKLSTRVLESLGYDVIAAEDGVIAFEMAKDYPKRVDLVFSDVVMPRCYGPEFVSKLREVRDDFEVLYTSGYRKDAFEEHVVERTVQLLPKPFTPEQLASRVRTILDQTQAEGKSEAA